ncbi:hypothetical protein NF212_03950 [Parasalinivibrio latis]|uniref:hypothetical protein n=1 Tax=Parasalinivibrio latis TaxID=2952610 RepID=UPI0030E5D472
MAETTDTVQSQRAPTLVQRVAMESEHWLDLALSSLSALNPSTELPLSIEGSEKDAAK